MSETLRKLQELIEQNKILEKRNEELKNIIDINLTQPDKEPIIPLIELIGKTEIENLVYKFYHSFKVPTALLSKHAEVLFSIGWKKLFTTHADLEKKITCTKEITEYMNQNIQDTKIFRCQCIQGFNTIAFPIEIKKEFRAILVLNQFFFKNEIPSYDSLLSLAKTNHIEEKAFLQLLSEIPVYSPNEIKNIIKQAIILSEMIAFIGTKNYEFYKQFKQQTDSNTLLNALKKKISEQEAIIKNFTLHITEHQKDIGENTINKSELEKETNKLVQKLARTETILNSILTSSPLGICFIKEGVITFVNDQMFQLSGYTTKEILGRPLNYILSETASLNDIMERSETAILKEHITFRSQIIRKDKKNINVLGFLAEIHQGKPNEGFTLSILNISSLDNNPVVTEDKKSETAQKNHFTSDWSQKTILIAEDEEINFIYMEKLLSPTNIKIKWAKNGQNAVDLIKEETDIDVILMDIKMPILNGIEATRIIKSINKSIPIIAQTAYVQENTKEAIFKAGCDEFLAKPININYFISVLEKYLNKNSKTTH